MRPSGVLHHLQFSHCWEKVCDWRDVSIRRWALPSAHQRVLPPPPPELMAPRRGCSSYISRPPETGSSLGPRLPTGRCPAYLQDVPLSATWGRAEWPGKGPTDNSDNINPNNFYNLLEFNKQVTIPTEKLDFFDLLNSSKMFCWK